MSSPLVSICIPAYNAAPFIEETINYWLNQTHQNTEIIICDDCSTDDTYKIAFKLAENEKRIKLFINEKNLGIGPNWNETYSKVTGDFVIIANADDIYEPKIIEEALAKFNTVCTLDAVSFKYNLYEQESNQTKPLEVHNLVNLGVQKHLFEICFFSNPFSIVFSVFKKSSLDRIILDNGELFLNTQICDTELFFRAGKNKFNLYFCDYVAGKYRKHATNNSYLPNGERNSWLFDVFPLYREYLLANHRLKTTRLFWDRIIHHLKYQLKHLKFSDYKQLKTFFKEYYFFKTSG